MPVQQLSWIRHVTWYLLQFSTHILPSLSLAAMNKCSSAFSLSRELVMLLGLALEIPTYFPTITLSTCESCFFASFIYLDALMTFIIVRLKSMPCNSCRSFALPDILKELVILYPSVVFDAVED
ncbi:hypothetical protein STEG23_003175 [Scotinomys teguina]